MDTLNINKYFIVLIITLLTEHSTNAQNSIEGPLFKLIKIEYQAIYPGNDAPSDINLNSNETLELNWDFESNESYSTIYNWRGDLQEKESIPFRLFGYFIQLEQGNAVIYTSGKKSGYKWIYPYSIDKDKQEIIFKCGNQKETHEKLTFKIDDINGKMILFFEKKDSVSRFSYEVNFIKEKKKLNKDDYEMNNNCFPLYHPVNLEHSQ